MTTTYSLNHDTLVKRLSIQARAPGESDYVPVGFVFEGEKEFPFDSLHLADNLRALLNDQEPPHRIDAGDHRILYQKTEGAVVLRWQDHGSGTTRVGPTITVSDADSVIDLGRDLLRKIDRAFMKKFCDAVETTAVAPASAPASPAPRSGYTPT